MPSCHGLGLRVVGLVESLVEGGFVEGLGLVAGGGLAEDNIAENYF